MGLDFHYQAMPENCELLIWARNEPDFGANLEFFNSYALMSLEELQKEIDDCSEDQLFVEFIRQTRKTVQRNPAIAHRNLYFGRKWDCIYYLLSERRRQCEERDWSNWVEKAIFGGQVLNELTQTTIGFPIRYLCPAEVFDIQNKLETVTIEKLHCHWNPQAMSKAGVYKSHVDQNENDFHWIQESFEKLRAFYTLVAERNEGVLAFVS